jgi:peptide subunit release factor RF-3
MERRQHRIEMENLNSERNELMLKKMTLNWSVGKQQNQMKKYHCWEKRQTWSYDEEKKNTENWSDQRFAMNINAGIEQIAKAKWKYNICWAVYKMGGH